MTRMLKQRIAGLALLALSAAIVLFARAYCSGDGAEVTAITVPVAFWMLASRKIIWG